MNFLVIIVNSQAVQWALGIFDIISTMRKRGKNKMAERPVFDSIRKPTAPPTRKLGPEKPEEKVHPAGRKSKHKKPEITEDQ
ncbi:MAG: hypothetical protein KA746_15840 [Pyrinomonadaceae bacterium]|nr:hypothetical protein [Pyrinomonadaceae bacterium]MBP6213398.1 hypothetical protein [Pyrinomonadaceae bacterium]